MISYRRARSNVGIVVGVILLLTAGAILHDATTVIEWIVAIALGTGGLMTLYAMFRFDERL